MAILRESLKWAILLGVLTSMGLCIGSDIYRVTRGPRKPASLVNYYAVWDTQLRHDAEPGRGVFLKFDAFSERTMEEAFAQTIYYRGVYALYPLPVLVTQSDVVVNEGKDFLAHNSYPSDQWLMDHGVGSVLMIGMDGRRKQPYVESVHWLGN